MAQLLRATTVPNPGFVAFQLSSGTVGGFLLCGLLHQIFQTGPDTDNVKRVKVSRMTTTDYGIDSHEVEERRELRWKGRGKRKDEKWKIWRKREKRRYLVL